MNNTLNKMFVFAAGAAVGSAITWKLVKTKYEQIAKEEIESVKEVLGRGRRIETNPVDDTAIDEGCEEEYDATDKDIDECKKILYSNGYCRHSDSKEDNDDERKEEEDMTPYVITPEAFEENEDYDVETLIYYADGVLTDEQNHVIEDVESLVGEESLTHFGDYPDDPDTVYVRNELTMTDYEILADERKYIEIY